MTKELAIMSRSSMGLKFWNIRTSMPFKKKGLLKIILQSVFAILKAKIFHISGIAKLMFQLLEQESQAYCLAKKDPYSLKIIKSKLACCTPPLCPLTLHSHNNSVTCPAMVPGATPPVPPPPPVPPEPRSPAQFLHRCLANAASLWLGLS